MIGLIIGIIILTIFALMGGKVAFHVPPPVIPPQARAGGAAVTLVCLGVAIYLVVLLVNEIKLKVTPVPTGYILVVVKNLNGNAVTAETKDKEGNAVKYKDKLQKKSGYVAGQQAELLVPEGGWVQVYCWAGGLHPTARYGYIYWDELLEKRGSKQNTKVELTVSCWAGYAAQSKSASGKPGYWHRNPPLRSSEKDSIRVTVKSMGGNFLNSEAWNENGTPVKPSTYKKNYPIGQLNDMLVPEGGYVKARCSDAKIPHPIARNGYLYSSDLLKLRGEDQNKSVDLTASCWGGYLAECSNPCGKPGYWRRHPPTPEGYIRVTVKNLGGNQVTPEIKDKKGKSVKVNGKSQKESGVHVGQTAELLVPEGGYVQVYCWAGAWYPTSRYGYFYWDELLKKRGSDQNKTVELTVSCWAGYAAQKTKKKAGYWHRDPPGEK